MKAKHHVLLIILKVKIMTNNTEKQVEKPNFYEFLNKPEIKPYQSTVDGKALYEGEFTVADAIARNKGAT